MKDEVNTTKKRSCGVKMLFAGDVYSENDSIMLSEAFKELLASHHVNCCNFEGPVACKNQVPAKENGIKLSQPDKVIDLLREGGFNLFALANNHIMNYGTEGLRCTLKHIPYDERIGAGEETKDVYKTVSYNINDLKVGVINCSECQYGTVEEYGFAGYAWIGSNNTYNSIKELKDRCDYIVLISHAGLENLDFPLPEWKDTYRRFIDLGVDVVVAHHPHVIQGYEEYKGGLIFYSLGNFIWNSRNVNSCKAPSFVVSVLFSKQGINYKIIPVEFSNDVLDIYDNCEFQNKINELNKKIKNPELYFDELNDVCVRESKKYENYLFETVGLRPNNRIRNRILNILSLVFRNKGIDKKRLYLLVSNETMRYTIKRGLFYNE